MKPQDAIFNGLFTHQTDSNLLTKSNTLFNIYKENPTDNNKQALYNIASTIVYKQLGIIGKAIPQDEQISIISNAIEKAIRTYDPSKSKQSFMFWCKLTIRSHYYNRLYHLTHNREDNYDIQDSILINYPSKYDIYDHININTITIKVIKKRIKVIIDDIIRVTPQCKCFKGWEQVLVDKIVHQKEWFEIGTKRGLEGRIDHNMSQNYISLIKRLKQDKILQGYFDIVKKG